MPFNPSEIDWVKIAQLLPSLADPRIRTGKLAEKDYWILVAGVNSKNRQVAGDAASLLTAQCRRFEQDWFNNIAFKAAQRGVSFEEMFVCFALGRDPNSVGQDMSTQVNPADYGVESEDAE
jgi:hypothetical protein